MGIKRSSEYKTRPPRKNTGGLNTKPGGGNATQRSNMLSNGSKPTSYGASSLHSMNHNNVLGKTSLSGMMGGNDHVWMSSRGAAGIPKGVRSETGSNHNISNNQP